MARSFAWTTTSSKELARQPRPVPMASTTFAQLSSARMATFVVAGMLLPSASKVPGLRRRADPETSLLLLICLSFTAFRLTVAPWLPVLLIPEASWRMILG